ncbi:hypothetical protein [Aureispira anguillae]|uniref:Uncharacterized protein n=1 Tax=Aureispira anguillae TaxID=2864201 RepID=A0A916DRA3_9BACT|nr:hypothetical protein [Aureispira anguillae]BDS11694.1 hypothetical protein AsAng_0024080 [Aureispira anguillae]
MNLLIIPIFLILGLFFLGMAILVIIKFKRKGDSGNLRPNEARADSPFSHFRHLDSKNL